MTLVADWPRIASVVDSIDTVTAMEQAFVAYSDGRCVVPPVGELRFDSPPGDVHIKYGYVRDDDYYVVKIASGFYDNPALGLPSSQGLMLLFRQRTGELAAVLLDEGRLTDLRTAAAGAVAAKHLGPRTVERIGVVGTGTQARAQVAHLRGVTGCRDVLAFGRDENHREAYAADVEALGFRVETTANAAEVAARCNLIVTTTPATAPLLAEVQPGTHVTAVGSDAPDKQELATSILAAADVVVADSLEQCRVRGEISHALRNGALEETQIVELGAVIRDRSGRPTDDSITVADLTGVAVQDVQIAAAVFTALATN